MQRDRTCANRRRSLAAGTRPASLATTFAWIGRNRRLARGGVEAIATAELDRRAGPWLDHRPESGQPLDARRHRLIHWTVEGGASMRVGSSLTLPAVVAATAMATKAGNQRVSDAMEGAAADAISLS